MSDLMNAIEREYSESKLVGAIQATGLVKPGLEADVAQLIGHGFALAIGPDGRPTLTAKSGKAVSQELAETLGSDRFGHFRGARPPGYRPDGTYSAVEHLKQQVAAVQGGGDGLAVGLSGLNRR